MYEGTQDVKSFLGKILDVFILSPRHFFNCMVATNVLNDFIVLLFHQKIEKET